MKASEILRRAESLADISNSDFISWIEKIDYLNDAYKFVYGKMDEFGDEYFAIDWMPQDDDFSDDYRKLRHLPSINGVKLVDDKSAEDLGLARAAAARTAVWGEISGEISSQADLGSVVSSLQAEIAEARRSAEQSVAALQATVNSLQATVNSLQATVNSLQATVNAKLDKSAFAFDASSATLTLSL